MSDPRHAFHAAVLAVLGFAPELIEPGRLHRFATSSRRGDTAGWCKLFADLRGGVFGCYRAGHSETWSATDRTSMTRAQRAELARQVMAATAEREAQQRERWTANATRIARVWAECRSLVPGDAVTLYLKRRGFGGVWPLPECLRMHRGLPYWQETEQVGTFPAMLAPLVAPDGRIVALHRTYLHSDGRAAGRRLHPLVQAGSRLHRHRRGDRNGAGCLVRFRLADRCRIQRRQPGRLAVACRRAAAGDFRRP
jgi:hypothetical protein